MNSYVFVTGNENKWREIQEVLSEYTTIQREQIEIIERQGTLEEISRDKACSAYRILQKPCIVEDVSLELDAIGGFPGPYVKHFLSKVSLDDVNRLTQVFGKEKITAHCSYALARSCNPTECMVFHGCIDGVVVPPRGTRGFGFDSIFEIDYNSSRLTLAEMSTTDKNMISHRGKALRELVKFFQNQSNP